MKDTEIRGILLQFYYENRRKPLTRPNPEDFGGTLTDDEILEVSDQLARHQLLDWKPLRAQNRIINGMGKISPFGIDVIEGTARADITIELVQNKNITITGSSNVILCALCAPETVIVPPVLLLPAAKKRSELLLIVCAEVAAAPVADVLQKSSVPQVPVAATGATEFPFASQ